MRTLVIIPAFNEASNLADVVCSIRTQFTGDVLVIDDGSDDATATEAGRAGTVVVRHSCNLGIGAAV